ncbi:hypothetical protein KALB_5188 [Kutzneria albida DSM 43870]|uniref:SAF domain-containing protein n=1 Tax=Kutzneria albida DSM 43870 TaxID=1449976 RepID=W5WCR6_9PSEU|nr:hypothetical protein KALB_5188 [Kutzneria albida DSM 43870]
MRITSVSSGADSTTKERTSTRPWRGRDNTSKAPSRLSGSGRRHSVPYLLLGILLIVVCAAGGVLAGMLVANRESMLALARPVTVGQPLTVQDLTHVSMAPDSGLDTVPASAASTVVGHPLAFSVPAGSLLTRSVLGTRQVPPPGRAIAAVGLKPGQFPPDLSSGTTVAVLTTPGQSATAGTSTGQTGAWTAVVTAVASRGTDQITVLSLQLSDSDARALASAPTGQLSVLAIAEGDR